MCFVLSCQFVLTPPILFPDCWLICPTCLTLQTWASLSSYVPLSCADPALPCLAFLVVPCPALSCQAWQLSCFSPKSVSSLFWKVIEIFWNRWEIDRLVLQFYGCFALQSPHQSHDWNLRISSPWLWTILSSDVKDGRQGKMCLFSCF